jgi:hypothetical protein
MARFLPGLDVEEPNDRQSWTSQTLRFELLATGVVRIICGSWVVEQIGYPTMSLLDHAGHDVWGNLPRVYLVEEWRSGPKLVPEAWLAK